MNRLADVKYIQASRKRGGGVCWTPNGDQEDEEVDQDSGQKPINSHLSMAGKIVSGTRTLSSRNACPKL